ncbi:hypothetical protein [Microbacterium foliorum]|uniref:Uncharacterized protein n=1 Tax=Microbacterium foliorum TaxID=104336 RepID=A0A0F0KLQ3_9MICO|nr:hypothetical protein [Microbacterium foliorum]KJL21788.1 hypothetical protein RN50_01689 [Microbacterium foliorum]
MEYQKLSRITVAVAVSAAMLLGGSSGAMAATNTSVDEDFSEFAASLGVTPEVEGELQTGFDKLSLTDQESFLSRTESDPKSVVRFESSVRVRELEATPQVQARAAAAVKTYQAKDTVTASILNVNVGSFTTDFKYEANTTKVTRVLTCKGAWAGFGLTGSSSASNYITSGGLGACEVIFNMNVVIKGSPISFAKQHVIKTHSGNPGRYTATLGNF